MDIGEKVNNNEGDANKFLELYERYEKRLYYYARKLIKDDGLAEDVIQSTFLSMINNMDKVDDIESKRTQNYLYTIVNHICINMVKQNKKYRYFYENEIDQADDFLLGIQTDDHIFESVDYEDLLHEIKQLPSNYSDVLILSGVYEYTNKEISEMLNMTEAAVRQRISRGRKRLKVQLGSI